MSLRRAPGFTLLEVLLATSIMAVGTTSVLVVIATAASMASKRQVLQRREQVLDEARHDAQAAVDSFNPSTPASSAPAAGSKDKKTGSKAAPAVRVAPDKVTDRKSTRYDGFMYDLAFQPRDPKSPEKGFDVAITVKYGGGDLSYGTTTTLIGTTIPESEFLESSTWQAEQAGEANGPKSREGKK